MKKLIIVLAFLVCGPAVAQWQVPNNSIPIGRGPGVVGFNSAASPGTGVQCLLDTIPPAFATCPTGGVAPGAVTLNVNHSTGVNSLTCGSVSTPCRTIYYAFQLFQSGVKVALGTSPVIQSDCGFSETPSGAFIGPVASGTGVVFIIGNEGSPASCVWTTNGISVDDGAVISLRGFTARTTTGSAGTQTFLFVQKLGLVVFANMIWGAANANIQVAEGGKFVWDPGTYQIGDAACAPACFNWHIINNGGLVALNQATASVPFALTWPNQFYSGNFSGSNGSIGPVTFTGAGAGAGSVGQKYVMSNNATLSLGSTILPGSVAGSTSTGGCVDGVCGNDIGSIQNQDRQTNTLAGDVLLNNTANFFTGPIVAHAGTGVMFATGIVSIVDTAGAAVLECKLWDGTTIISSGILITSVAGDIKPFTLSGYMAAPAGALRISCKDSSSVNGKILATYSSLFTYRIN